MNMILDGLRLLCLLLLGLFALLFILVACVIGSVLIHGSRPRPRTEQITYLPPPTEVDILASYSLIPPPPITKSRLHGDQIENLLRKLEHDSGNN
jgi:hypothetical protein